LSNIAAPSLQLLAVLHCTHDSLARTTVNTLVTSAKHDSALEKWLSADAAEAHTLPRSSLAACLLGNVNNINRCTRSDVPLHGRCQ
jgi:hypothetical protein